MASKKRAVPPELLRLRALAKRDRANATAKIYRIRKNQHIDISGTDQDPRRPVSVINTYNSNQLRAYIQKLEQFSDRSTSFVAGAGGVPLPKTLYQQFERLQAAHNAISDARMSERADITLRDSDITLQGRHDEIIDRLYKMGQGIVNEPFSKLDYAAESIESTEALKQLIKTVKDRMRPSTLKRLLDEQWSQAEHMLAIIGDSVSIENLRSLTPHQFDILFNSTPFASNLSAKYETFRKMAAKQKERWYDSQVEDRIDSLINSEIEWAKKLPKKSNIKYQAPKDNK